MIVILVIVGAVVWGIYDSGGFGGSDGGFSTSQVFGTRESGRLVERLDAAAKTQKVCYGWEIDSGRSSSISPITPLSPITPSTARGATPPPVQRRPGVEVGSNLGTGIDPRQAPRQCRKWVVFVADYTYSSVDEEWTSVTREVKTNLPVSVTSADLTQAGIETKDLLGDNANARLADAIGSLPMIVAEKGAAPVVPEAAGQAPPAGDKASSPSATRYIWFGIAGLLIVGGLAWITVAAVRSRRGVGPLEGGREIRGVGPLEGGREIRSIDAE